MLRMAIMCMSAFLLFAVAGCDKKPTAQEQSSIEAQIAAKPVTQEQKDEALRQMFSRSPEKMPTYEELVKKNK